MGDSTTPNASGETSISITGDNQNNILSNLFGSVNTDGGDIAVNFNGGDTVSEEGLNDVIEDEELTENNGVITLKNNITVENKLFENKILKADNVDNINLDNNEFKNCRLLFNKVTNLSITNNKISDPYLVSDDPEYVNSNGEQAKYARGMELLECDNIKVEYNSLSNCIGDGILITNVGKNSDNVIKHNLIELSDASDVDTNLEASILIRNNVDGHLNISNNIIRDNLPNSNQTNRCDGIEINLNRATNYAGEDAFIDNVAGPSDVPVTFTADILNNSVLNLGGSADGIDLNVGNNSTLYINVMENTVVDVGDEGLTLDTFGPNIKVKGVFSENYFSTTGSKGSRRDKDGNLDEDGSTDGMSFTLSELIDGTTVKNDKVDLDFDLIIKNNTFIADTQNLAGTNEKPDKAEGIKITVGEGLDSDIVGDIKLNASILNNSVKTRAGPGFKIALLEKCKNINLTSELNILDNNFEKYNNANEAGEPYTGLKDIGQVVLLEDGEGNCTISGNINIDRNNFISHNNLNPKLSVTNEGSSEDIENLSLRLDLNTGVEVVGL